MALLAVLVVGLSFLGGMGYHYMQRGSEKAVADTSGFDLSTAIEAKSGPSSAAPAQTSRSSLGMVQTGLPGMQIDSQGNTNQNTSQQAQPGAKMSFTQAVHASENKIRALAVKYTQKYPVIGQYGREWMSHPDLKALNDDYMRDRDPIKFIKGVSQSKNFGAMVKKYATNPTMSAFVKEGIGAAAPGAMGAAMDFMKQEKAVKDVITNVASSMGLPPALLGGLAGGGSAPPVDEKQVMGQIMGSNPDLQKAMQGNLDPSKIPQGVDAGKLPKPK